MNNILPIFEFLKRQSTVGMKTALVTLTSVTGASTRNPGAHMAVAEDGSYAGSFSGGCVENAVVAEALSATKDSQPREVRFGSGSPYLDIRLPCGGGIDLLFSPISNAQTANDLFEIARKRVPFTLRLNRSGEGVQLTETRATEAVTLDETAVTVGHIPPARLIILGHGASVEHLASLTRSYGIDCHTLTSDPGIAERITAEKGKADLLKTPAATGIFEPDSWTACVFLFHDHDWEVQLIKQALQSPAYYVGAMGSLKTHETRKAMLRSAGVTDEEMARMSAPVGLIASTRDPATLALSTLAEVVKEYHNSFN